MHIPDDCEDWSGVKLETVPVPRSKEPQTSPSNIRYNINQPNYKTHTPFVPHLPLFAIIEAETETFVRKRSTMFVCQFTAVLRIRKKFHRIRHSEKNRIQIHPSLEKIRSIFYRLNYAT